MTAWDGRPRLAGLWWALGWAMVLFILYATLAPSRDVPDLHLNDKFEHATAFFGMTFLIALGVLLALPRGRGSWLRWVESVLGR